MTTIELTHLLPSRTNDGAAIRDEIARAVFYAQWGWYGHEWDDCLATGFGCGDAGIVTASYEIADAVIAAMVARFGTSAPADRRAIARTPE